MATTAATRSMIKLGILSDFSSASDDDSSSVCFGLSAFCAFAAAEPGTIGFGGIAPAGGLGTAAPEAGGFGGIAPAGGLAAAAPEALGFGGNAPGGGGVGAAEPDV